MNINKNYLITGAKVFALSVILSIIYTIFNFILGLFVAGADLINLLMNKPTGVAMVIVIVIFIAYLAAVLYVGGYIATKLWKWH